MKIIPIQDYYAGIGVSFLNKQVTVIEDINDVINVYLNKWVKIEDTELFVENIY